MRVYTIILSDIESEEIDRKFADYVHENKFDYWRYSALNWIIVTPDEVYTNNLVLELNSVYSASLLICVLEIAIKDIGGRFLTTKEEQEQNPHSPFDFFHKIQSPDFIPRWLKESITK